MNAFKRFFVERAAKAAAKRERPFQRTPNYAEAKSVGLLLHTRSPFREIDDLYDGFAKEGKRVAALSVQGDDTPAYRFPSVILTEKEFGLFGQLDNEPAAGFLGERFDFLYCISDEESLLVDYALAHSQANCRVGAHAAGKESLFELMVCPPNPTGVPGQIAQMMHYTRAIVRNAPLAA